MPTSNTSSRWDVLDPRTAWGKVYLGLLLLRCYSAFYGYGYIHPDEWMQSGEPYFGLTLPGIDASVPWEWRPDRALRSFSTLRFQYAPADFLLYLLGKIVTRSGRGLFLVQRAGMLISSLLIDMYVLTDLPPQTARYILCLFGISTAATTFLVRPFSNSHESHLLAICILFFIRFLSDRVGYRGGRYDWYRSILLPSILAVDGFFTRFTFPIFAFPLSLYAVRHCQRIVREGYPRAVVTSLAIGAAAFSAMLYLRVSEETSVYTQLAKSSSMELAGVWKSKWVVPPINALLYNVKTDNVAQHGLHPRWLHAVVNLPMIVGVANCVVIVIHGYHFVRGLWPLANPVLGTVHTGTSSKTEMTLEKEEQEAVEQAIKASLTEHESRDDHLSASDRPAQQAGSHAVSDSSTTTEPSTSTSRAAVEVETEIEYVDIEPIAVGVSLSIIVFSLSILSISPHQEPRFLLPLAFPATIIMAYALQNCSYLTSRPGLSRLLIALHAAQHLIQMLLFSFLHQGALLPALFSIDRSISLLPTHGDSLFTRYEHHILYRTFSVPFHFLPNKGRGMFPRVESYDSSFSPAYAVRMASIACNHTSLYAPSWIIPQLESRAELVGRVELVKVESFTWHVDMDHLGETFGLVGELGWRDAFAIQKLDVRCKTHSSSEENAKVTGEEEEKEEEEENQQKQQQQQQPPPPEDGHAVRPHDEL